jgi:F-type H+-transporting ATPase subunit epsilon
VAQIEVTVTTPQGVQLREQVDELTAPSVQGEFGVLPGHLPLLAGLKTGVVRLVSRGETQQFAVGPGFVQVTDGRAAILTDRFIKKSDVDPVVCRKELKEAEDEVDASSAKPEELRAAIAKARWAAVCLELYGDAPPPTLMMDLETKLVGYEDFLHVLEADRVQDSEAQGERGGEA